MKSFYNSQSLKDKMRILRKNQTDAERILWKYLRNKQLSGLKFFRQYGVGNYILDFYCPTLRLALEIDGGQHNDRGNILLDNNITKFLNTLNIKVIRFWNNDITKNISGVIEKILNEINNPT